MSIRHHAYNAVMDELKDHIRGHSSKKHKSYIEKFNRPRDPHHEPDGDEDTEGNEYPGSPDDMGKVESQNVEQKKFAEKHGGLEQCTTCGRKLDDEGKCSGCDYEEDDIGNFEA